MNLRTVNVTRYIQALREGGSLPALADANDDFKYVLKFRGAGHGTKALIAEYLGGEIARAMGLPVPELVFIELDEAFGRTEADEEIQELLQKSRGLNLGLHFLSGALNFDPNTQEVNSKLASQVVWLDAFITNVDRTFRNTNLLLWHKELWLIDHGAAFYFHHSWDAWEKHALSPFALIKDHVLLPQANLLDEVNAAFQLLLTDEKLKEIVELLPDDWLEWEGNDQTPAEIRAIYYQFLVLRKANADTFVNQAKMQEPHLYEYAVIRVVPKVERDEFINVGLILFCKRQRYIRMEFQINQAKFNLFNTEIGIDDVQAYLISFQDTANGTKAGGRIGQLETPERFRWLTAVRSSVLQTSRPHAGLSEDLDKTFNVLFTELVL